MKFADLAEATRWHPTDEDLLLFADSDVPVQALLDRLEGNGDVTEAMGTRPTVEDDLADFLEEHPGVREDNARCVAEAWRTLRRQTNRARASEQLVQIADWWRTADQLADEIARGELWPNTRPRPSDVRPLFDPEPSGKGLGALLGKYVDEEKEEAAPDPREAEDDSASRAAGPLKAALHNLTDAASSLAEAAGELQRGHPVHAQLLRNQRNQIETVYAELLPGPADG